MEEQKLNIKQNEKKNLDYDRKQYLFVMAKIIQNIHA